jgi:cytochrome b subunit of formate dehydrogenase
MGLIEWARSPWGQDIPIHIAFYLIWVAAIVGLVFLIGHAIWLRYFAKPEEFAVSTSAAGVGGSSRVAAGSRVASAALPERVPRHSLAARLFHWIMAAAMFALLITAFLPRIGVRFPWVTYHWIAGIVLTGSIIFHVIHATFYLDPWSIWPDKADIEDAGRRLRRSLGQSAPPPRRFAKYPLENKMYHGVIVLAGLAATITGVFMMFRVRTGILPRNPYLFGDMTWGMMYVLHGLAGVGLIALIMIHVYFAVRPEKLDITKSMIFGSMSREHYLEHHDPERWAPGVSER